MEISLCTPSAKERKTHQCKQKTSLACSILGQRHYSLNTIRFEIKVLFTYLSGLMQILRVFYHIYGPGWRYTLT